MLLLILFGWLYVQDQQNHVVPDRYLLYHINKDVLWIHNGIKEPARRGVFIEEHHALQLSAKADVMLIQNDGKSILLKEPGQFTFQQIKSRFKKLQETGVTSAFFAYVFEKFLKAGNNETRQKITGVVFRGNELMAAPTDSSFKLDAPVTVSWKTKQRSIPHKISIRINGVIHDTVVRNQLQCTLPAAWLQASAEKGTLVRWKCYPSDSRQSEAFASWIFLVPTPADSAIISHQLQQLRLNYKTDPSLLKIMERDLLERWIELYQLQMY